MRNPLKSLNVGHEGQPFRLSLMCVCARMYARISELYGSLVPHVPPLFGSSPWGHALRGTRSPAATLFPNFQIRRESGCDIAFWNV